MVTRSSLVTSQESEPQGSLRDAGQSHSTDHTPQPTAVRASLLTDCCKRQLKCGKETAPWSSCSGQTDSLGLEMAPSQACNTRTWVQILESMLLKS